MTWMGRGLWTWADTRIIWWSVVPGGQEDQEHGVVLHDQEEGYQPPITSRTGSSQVPHGLSIPPLPVKVDQVDNKIKDMG